VKTYKFGFTVVTMLFTGLVAIVGHGWYSTERDIRDFQSRIEAIADEGRQNYASNKAALAEVPEPVKKYFKYVFPNDVPEAHRMRVEAAGRFRRPLTESFYPITTEQVIAIGSPALMFSGTTSVLPGVWARAYDFFANGEMEMKAKVLSTITVVDERETPELNMISLRRWLMESTLIPQALLPGGAVTWEPLDDTSSRAIVTADGMHASVIAHFDDIGR